MLCKICGEKKDVLPILSVHICKKCMKDIISIDVYDENYDFYKNMIRIYLAYYTGRNLIKI